MERTMGQKEEIRILSPFILNKRDCTNVICIITTSINNNMPHIAVRN